ncbi:MAG: hypothetical protein NTU47_03890 [Ignavibacteriales bacterium]|nr:hypothetical protein [Ignavibacteriales bacterium]
MNLGQTMLTAGMLMLLIMSVVSANRMIGENTQAQLQTQALAISATLANDLLLEILSRKFDANSDTLGLKVPSDFDDADHLAPGASELANCPQPDSSYVGAFRSITAYNDVDDYNGYRRIVTSNGLSGFKLDVVIYYVSSGTPDTKTTSRTNFKRIQVTVTQDQFLTTALNNVPVYTALASY